MGDIIQFEPKIDVAVELEKEEQAAVCGCGCRQWLVWGDPENSYVSRFECVDCGMIVDAETGERRSDDR